MVEVVKSIASIWCLPRKGIATIWELRDTEKPHNHPYEVFNLSGVWILYGLSKHGGLNSLSPIPVYEVAPVKTATLIQM